MGFISNHDDIAPLGQQRIVHFAGIRREFLNGGEDEATLSDAKQGLQVFAVLRLNRSLSQEFGSIREGSEELVVEVVAIRQEGGPNGKKVIQEVGLEAKRMRYGIELYSQLEQETGLATGWTIVSPTTMELKLRPDVRFQNGDLMTADGTAAAAGIGQVTVGRLYNTAIESASLSGLTATAGTGDVSEATKHIRTITGEINALRAKRDSLRADIAKKFPTYADLIDPKPPSVNQIKATLKPGEAVPPKWPFGAVSGASSSATGST